MHGTMLYSLQARVLTILNLRINGGERHISCFNQSTVDPMLRPLPNFVLLEMQWILHRVAAMSGAAEPQDEYGDSDDDDDGNDGNDLPMAVQKRLNLYMDI